MATQTPKRFEWRLDIEVLIATIMAPSMVFLVSTALSVALPAIQRDLGASGTDLIWTVNAYSLLQAAFIFLSGSFGDHYGRKRVYLIGIIIFGLSSLVCGTTNSAAVLILGRAFQGVGSGMMITCSLAIVAAFFFHHRRSWSIGVWSGFTMLISGAGPILGGWLTELGMWRMIFLINVPLGLVACLVLIAYVPESYDEDAPKGLDISGTFLSTMALMLSGFFCIEGPRRGFDDPLVLLSGLAAIATLPAFLWIEGHSDHPMMPLNLFRSRTFTGANTLTLLLYGAMNSVLFFLPLSLIQVQRYSAAAVGFALLPMSVFMVALSFVMSRVLDRFGPRLPLIFGPLLISLSFVLLATLQPHSGQDTYWTTLFPAICLLGIGMGVTLAPLTTAVMASVDEHHAGMASGLNNTVSRSAQVLAIAVMGGIVLALFKQTLLSDPTVTALPSDARALLSAESVKLAETSLPAELSPLVRSRLQDLIRQAFSDTINVIMWIAAGLSLLSAVLSALLIERELPFPE
ncbi:MAG: MFS transporter [Chloroflexi bacterium]|nr:MFS transporter [Chloroflexota bacterium]